MANVTIDIIKTKIEDLICTFGGQGGVALTSDPYRACNPNRPNRWDATAVELDGFILRTGKGLWNFDEFAADCEAKGVVIDDNSMYPWEDEFEFVVEEEFNLEDSDNLEMADNILEM